ncbi:uncharacterized protein LOC129915660 [Episyrphus balteatus]|uniref:uncharacterized protein LOC129915660 n=1 Tax=Episyrphus balteatus TaxID=286459 RepID=UPI0024851D00|nr:uncharacterized protein LOC129915660 [Episyrphus balteatus]
MNLKYQLVIVIITIFSHFCIASKFNKSLSDYEVGCEVYKREKFDSYDLFQVSSVNKNLKNNKERLHLKFYVMTESYAFIVLSEVDNPKVLNEINNRGYEIDLGSYSWITNSSDETVHEKDSPNLFSKVKPTPVEIIITNDNKLLVNIPGYYEPFMKYSDTHSLNIKFFRFGSYNKWFYNCTFDENSNVEDQKMSENEVKTVETKNTNVNQQQLSLQPKSTANPTETRPFSKHNSFFDVLVPMLDKFDDNKMLDFQLRVFEVVKELKNNPTTTTKKPVAIDVRFGGSENEIKTVESKNTNVNQQQLSLQPKSTANPTETRPFSKHNSFFDVLVPMLDKFDDNKMLDFQLRVFEVVKELKNNPTTTTKKPVAIDVRFG